MPRKRKSDVDEVCKDSQVADKRKKNGHLRLEIGGAVEKEVAAHPVAVVDDRTKQLNGLDADDGDLAKSKTQQSGVTTLTTAGKEDNDTDIAIHNVNGISEAQTQDLDLFLDNTPPPSCQSSQNLMNGHDVDPSSSTPTSASSGTSTTPGKKRSRITSAHTEEILRSPVKMMPSPPENAINIAVASRALFQMDTEHDIFTEQGLDKYIKYHMELEDVPLGKGTAFPFVQALEHVNSCLRSLNETERNVFNIVLMSHNHAQTGVRLIRSLQHHNLNIQRVCLTGGSNPVDYLTAYNVKLYLTSYPEEVEEALDKGFAAAAMLDQHITNPVRDQLRIAFDLDAVLFSLDSDFVHKEHGFAAYIDHEQEHANQPINEGPLKEFAAAIGKMKQILAEHREQFEVFPIRIYVVTARSACVGERALKTLRSWGVEVDELHFLSGASKGPILAAIKPHIFFDDAHTNIDHARAVGTPAAHVKHSCKTAPLLPPTQTDI